MQLLPIELIRNWWRTYRWWQDVMNDTAPFCLELCVRQCRQVPAVSQTFLSSIVRRLERPSYWTTQHEAVTARRFRPFAIRTTWRSKQIILLPVAGDLVVSFELLIRAPPWRLGCQVLICGYQDDRLTGYNQSPNRQVFFLPVKMAVISHLYFDISWNHRLITKCRESHKWSIIGVISISNWHLIILNLIKKYIYIE